MESRGEGVDETTTSRPAIARRSCDHCRARKIGCDRGSPCSNCVSARLHCTHSAVATKTTNSKQRVLITTKYEQKIDDIARDIDGIKHLLRGLEVAPEVKHQQNGCSYSKVTPSEEKVDIPSIAEPTWDYSGHIVDFIKGVVNDRDKGIMIEHNPIISSLRSLLHAVESKTPGPHLPIPSINTTKHQAHSAMPPLDAAVAVLRWAKGQVPPSFDDSTCLTYNVAANGKHPRMVWISRVLPLETFSDICRKIYFAIDDYNEIEFILANGYLSYIFCEHISVSGLYDYQEYSRLCRDNLQNACAHLPLLLPPSMEVIAALTLGAFTAVEDFRVSMAWSFISNASNLCQTLGYHLAHPAKDVNQSSRMAEARLFWTVYRMEKGLSLRLGRSSNIRDIDITLPFDREGERHSKLARVQGKVWDQLYSPTSLAQVNTQVRGQIAEGLADELREIINKTHSDVSIGEVDEDTSRDVYSQAELVCQSSLLALILRATPPPLGSLSSASDDCVTVARDVLDLHQLCVESMRDNYKNDPYMLNKYLSWSVVHHPFVPFSILFSRAVQLLDISDMERLERFAASLQPEKTSTRPSANIQRLYELLCQAARLYIDVKTSSHLTANERLPYSALDAPGNVTFTDFDMGARTVVNEPLEPGVTQSYDLSDWYYGNQQLMSLLDDDVTF